MKLHFFLALALLFPDAAAAQSLDQTLSGEPASPPDTSGSVPLSSFEAIQAPPPLGPSAGGAATAPPPLRLQIDPNLSPIGPFTPPPPVAPRIPGKEPQQPRPPAPSDWR